MLHGPGGGFLEKIPLAQEALSFAAGLQVSQRF
jgi:hypothetical protein